MPITFWGITPEQEFYQTWGLRWKVKNQKNFHFALFLGKTKDEKFEQIWAKMDFQQKPGSATFYHLKSPNFMKKSEKD